MKIWILHAGIGHPSPYFYNLRKELEKYQDIEITINSELPNASPNGKGIVYFNRLKRYYNSEDRNSIYLFMDEISKLKEMGWIIAFTLHNFFPIDQEYNENDDLMINLFIKKVDIVFTFTNYMKKKVKELFGINAITHYTGINNLDDWFDQDQVKLEMIDDDDFVFTFLGNITRYKMLPEFINAFNKIDNPKIKFIIAGPTGRNYSIKIDNSNIIRFDNFIGNKDWRKLCDRTNIFINSYDLDIPSFKYGFFPSNCIQLSYNKKICLVPKSAIIEELLPKGYYYEYSSKDTNDLTALLIQIINDKDIIKKKEEKYPDINYSWEKTVKIIVEEFRKYE